MNRTTGRRAAPRESARGRLLIIAAAVVAVVVLAALGFGLLGGNDGAEDRASQTPNGSATTGTPPSAAPEGGGSSDPTGSDPLPSQGAIRTASDLEGLALRGSDLPPGWRTLDAVGAATNELIGACLREAVTPTVPHVVLTQSFRSGSDGPVLTTSVRDFGTGERAASAMRTLTAAVQKCVRGTGSPDLTASSVSTGAQETVAVRFTITRRGTSARGEVIIARVGARSTTQILIGLTESDLETGRDAVRVAVQRLR